MGILQSLIEQSRRPSGLLGRLMLRIMNNAHSGLMRMGLSQLRSGGNVLDVSCSGGNAIAMMEQMKRFEHIYGIDISPDAVALAIGKNHKSIENGLVTIRQASVLELPFDDDFLMRRWPSNRITIGCRYCRRCVRFIGF